MNVTKPKVFGNNTWLSKRKFFPFLVAAASLFLTGELAAQNVQPTLVGGTPTLTHEAVGYLSTSTRDSLQEPQVRVARLKLLKLMASNHP